MHAIHRAMCRVGLEATELRPTAKDTVQFKVLVSLAADFGTDAPQRAWSVFCCESWHVRVVLSRALFT